jgi:ribosomal protein S18 acetylase RimI-like enzyme
MHSAISIRNARASDYTQLQALFEELDGFHRAGAPWLLRKPERNPRPLEWLETLLGSQKSTLFVADAGACVGLATVYLRDAPQVDVFIRQEHAVIDDLIVHRSWRRKGVGRRLYEACEAWALERNASWIDVNVYEFNVEAYNFYTSAGFATTMRKMRKPLGGRS